MKYRLLTVIVVFATVVVCSFLAFPEYVALFGLMDQVERTDAEIADTAAQIRLKNQQFIQLRGPSAPKTLRTIVGYISRFTSTDPDMEIVSIHNFWESGDGVELIGIVTNLGSTVPCDGYELSIKISPAKFAEFVQFLDQGGLTFHSADFLFGAQTAVLRIKVGDISG